MCFGVFSVICSWCKDTTGCMHGSVTWMLSLSCVPISLSMLGWGILWVLALTGFFVEVKYVHSVVWPVAANFLDATRMKSVLSKKGRFLLIRDFKRISSSVWKFFCLGGWLHISLWSI